MTDVAWVGAALASARPQAVGALARYFRDLDAAEEAFADASLRALKAWPINGPPRDPAAWLIFVGRNAGVDRVRKSAKETELPDERELSDLEDEEEAVVERIDGGAYRDDILRLLFICCHPDLPPPQQIALALRIVSGLTVPQIARAFLVSEAAMEQRITRAKARIAKSGDSFETPTAAERDARVEAVAAMLYLVFNEGYSTPEAAAERRGLCDEAIRLGRLLLRLFPAEPELMGLVALMLLQHARAPARLDGKGAVMLLEHQDRSQWDREAIAEGLALMDKAMRHRRPGPYQAQAAVAALHARARNWAETDWAQIALLYAALEAMVPSPVITLNRAAALAKVDGPEAALDLIEPLADRLGSYFYFHGMRGALLKELGRAAEARAAFGQAIALAKSGAEAAHIRAELDALAG